jgi:transcriptional regulator with XRE-family HTH domain
MSDELTSLAAILRHERGLSQTEIARRLGLSNIVISRILQRAKETGVVRTEVRLPCQQAVDLGERIARAYGLAEAFVVCVPEGEQDTAVQVLGSAHESAAAGGLGAGPRLGHDPCGGHQGIDPDAARGAARGADHRRFVVRHGGEPVRHPPGGLPEAGRPRSQDSNAGACGIAAPKRPSGWVLSMRAVSSTRRWSLRTQRLLCSG